MFEKRAKTCVTTGISLVDSEKGLYYFLTSLDISFPSVKFIYSRDCHVAKIIVSNDQAKLIEDFDILPDGMYCSPWMNVSRLHGLSGTQQ